MNRVRKFPSLLLPVSVVKPYGAPSFAHQHLSEFPFFSFPFQTSPPAGQSWLRLLMMRGCRSTWGGLEEYGQTRGAAATADKQTDDCSLQEAQLQNDQDRAEHQRPTYVTLLDISTLTSGGQNKRRAVTDEEVVKATSAAPGFFFSNPDIRVRLASLLYLLRFHGRVRYA